MNYPGMQPPVAGYPNSAVEAEQKQPTPIEEYRGLIHKIAKSPMCLILAILASIIALLSVISFFTTVTSMNTFSIFTLVFALLMPTASITTSVGLWLLWAKAQNNTKLNPAHFGLVGSLPSFLMIIIYLIDALFVLLYSMVAFLASAAINVFDDLLEGLAENSEVFEEASNMLSDISSNATAILVFIFLIIEAVFVFCIIRFSKINNAISSVGKSLKNNKVVAITNPMFSAVLSFIIALGALAMGGLLFSISVLSGISFICYAGMMSIAGVILIMNKSELARINDLQDAFNEAASNAAGGQPVVIINAPPQPYSQQPQQYGQPLPPYPQQPQQQYPQQPQQQYPQQPQQQYPQQPQQQYPQQPNK